MGSDLSPRPYPVLEPTVLKCHRQPTGGGWRIHTRYWVFEAETLPQAQEKAREVFPAAIFVLYFPDRVPRRRKRGRS